MEEIVNNYIEYLKEKLRLKYWRCEHDWEQLEKMIVTNWNINKGYSYLYRCKKCGEEKHYRTND